MLRALISRQPKPPKRRAGKPRRFATASEFAEWLESADESDGLTKVLLLTLYAEYCEYADRVPLTEHQLLRHARAAGIERYRMPTGRREYLYRVSRMRTE